MTPDEPTKAEVEEAAKELGIDIDSADEASSPRPPKGPEDDLDDSTHADLVAPVDESVCNLLRTRAGRGRKDELHQEELRQTRAASRPIPDHMNRRRKVRLIGGSAAVLIIATIYSRSATP